MMAAFPPTLIAVHRWFSALEDPAAAMEEVGLLLHDDLEPAGYRCTPANAATFASTGGDGVHFSFIDVGDGVHEGSPIVMTVPMARVPNWIVGETLREFLSLGLGTGYFSLEQLAYDSSWPATLESLVGTAESDILVGLSDDLDLRPWSGVAERLRVLEDHYLSALIVEDRPDDTD